MDEEQRLLAYKEQLVKHRAVIAEWQANVTREITAEMNRHQQFIGRLSRMAAENMDKLEAIDQELADLDLSDD